jgi:hypothetical protein
MNETPQHDYPKGETMGAGSDGTEPNAPDPASVPPSHFSTGETRPNKWAKGSGDHKQAPGVPGNKHAARRSVNQIRADRILLTDLMVRGMTLEQMADKLAEVRGYRLHFSTINREVRFITDDYKKRNDDLLDRHRQRQLMRLDAQEQEAWRAWEKSKEDAITKQGERSTGQGQNGANGGREKSLVRQAGRVGNAEFLRVMLAIAERRCKLLGLDAPNRNVLMNPDGTAIQPATPAAVLILPEEQMARLTDGEAQRLSKEFYKTLSERRYGNGSGNGNGHSPAPSNGNGQNGSNGNGNGNGYGVAVEYDGGEDEPGEEAG